MKISSSSENTHIDFHQIFDKYKDIIVTIPELNGYYTYDSGGNLHFHNWNNQQTCVNRINHQLFLSAVNSSSQLEPSQQVRYLNYSFLEYIYFATSQEYNEFVKRHNIVDCGLPTKIVQSEEKNTEELETIQRNYKKIILGIIFAAGLGFAGNAFYSPSKQEEEFKNFRNFEMMLVKMGNDIYKDGHFLSIETDMKRFFEDELATELRFRGCDFFPENCQNLKVNVEIVEESKNITVAVNVFFKTNYPNIFLSKYQTKKLFKSFFYFCKKSFFFGKNQYKESDKIKHLEQ